VGLAGMLAAALTLAAAGTSGDRADAQSAQPVAHVDVVQITGLIDPVEADFVRHAVAGAASDGAEALVVQLDSSHGVISPSRTAALAATVTSSRVPVAVWV